MQLLDNARMSPRNIKNTLDAFKVVTAKVTYQISKLKYHMLNIYIAVDIGGRLCSITLPLLVFKMVK